MMSILPQASIAVWTSLSGASPLVRSPAKTAVSPAISEAVCSATSPSRSLMTTFAPGVLSSVVEAVPPFGEWWGGALDVRDGVDHGIRGFLELLESGSDERLPSRD